MNGEERGPMGRLCKVRRGSRERRDRVSEERRGEEREYRAWRPTEASRMSQREDKDAASGPTTEASRDAAGRCCFSVVHHPVNGPNFFHRHG
jgi:hypothetical protein